MKIWVDADACPVVIKEILYKAAKRCQIPLMLVANQPLTVPASPLINCIQVSQGFDVADNEIIKRIEPEDLLITADIPLAAEAIDKKAQVLSPRGELFTADNIKSRLGMRDFLETLRSSGIHSAGPKTMDQADRQKFANQLDRILAKRKPE